MILSSDLHPRDTYALLTSLVVPRPIAWVSTMSEDGATNLAPFSYFTGLGSDPPMVTIAISDKRAPASEGGAFVAKDTLRIARDTGVLCINLVEEHDAERMNASSREYPADVSELEALGIAALPCSVIRGVRVASSRAAMECKVVDVHRYGAKVKVNLVVCEVVCFHVDGALLGDGESPVSAAIDDRVSPVARLGGPRYATLGARFALERPASSRKG